MVNEADRDGEGKMNEAEFHLVTKKKGGDPLDKLDSDEDDSQLQYIGNSVVSSSL